MKKRELIVTIGKDGNVTIDVQGFSGDGCEEFTKELEEELGVVIKRSKKPEYYQEEELHEEFTVGEE